MHILAGLTQGITSAGAPSPFAEKLNKLVVDSLATISKVMKQEFRGFSFGKFRVHDFECDDSGEYLTLYVNGGDTRAQPVIQIRSDEYKRVLRVIPWVYDLEEEDEDYYNKQQGEIKYGDISDIAKSLEYALFNSNVTPFSTSEFKREVGKLAKYLQKEIQSSTRINATLTAAKNFGEDADILKMVQYSLKELEKMARTKNLQVDSISNNRNTLEVECVPADDPYSSDFSLTCELDSDYLTIYGNVGGKRNKLAYSENSDFDGIVYDLSTALLHVLKNETNRRRAEKAMDKFEEAVQDVRFGRRYY